MKANAPLGRRGALGDDLAEVTPSLPPAADQPLQHGTIAELESWLRAVDQGRPWHPHAACTLCRREVARAA